MWGVIAIVALLIINLIKDPGYLAISISDSGNLVGNTIDILRSAAPILMIAVGMTLVIATAGIDLSVGSIMVVSGAVSMEFLKGSESANSIGTALAALGLALAIGTVLGTINGILRSEEHTSELQSRGHLVCRLLLEKKNIHPSDQFSYSCGRDVVEPA